MQPQPLDNDRNDGNLIDGDNGEVDEGIEEEILGGLFEFGDAEDEDAFDEDDYEQDLNDTVVTPEDLNSQRQHEPLDGSS